MVGAEAVGGTPVPVNATVCGLPEALSATLTLALNDARLAGVKSTMIVQLLPAVTVPPFAHVPPVIAKSAGFSPVSVMPPDELIVREDVPILLS